MANTQSWLNITHIYVYLATLSAPHLPLQLTLPPPQHPPPHLPHTEAPELLMKHTLDSDEGEEVMACARSRGPVW
jgi:hypothetical protein